VVATEIRRLADQTRSRPFTEQMVKEIQPAVAAV
jgi:hypothetical protein